MRKQLQQRTKLFANSVIGMAMTVTVIATASYAGDDAIPDGTELGGTHSGPVGGGQCQFKVQTCSRAFDAALISQASISMAVDGTLQLKKSISGTISYSERIDFPTNPGVMQANGTFPPGTKGLVTATLGFKYSPEWTATLGGGAAGNKICSGFTLRPVLDTFNTVGTKNIDLSGMTVCQAQSRITALQDAATEQAIADFTTRINDITGMVAFGIADSPSLPPVPGQAAGGSWAMEFCKMGTAAVSFTLGFMKAMNPLCPGL